MVERLRAIHPDIEFVIEIIQTTGDLRRDVPFAQVGTKGMFVKEIEQALLDGTIDIGVHSLKDMPGELPYGLELACIPPREDPFDAFLSNAYPSLQALPSGAVVGTSSLRRQAQIRYLRPDLRVAELRGNLDTRLRKLDGGEYAAIILACAGLNRLGLAERIRAHLSVAESVPAVGQGALALETRASDGGTKALLEPLNHAETADAVRAERGFLAALGGGCTVPAGALAVISGENLSLEAMLAAPDGSRLLRVRRDGAREQGAEIGREAAEFLLAGGGETLLKGDSSE